MTDMQTQLNKLLIEAEDCALISKLATDAAKRELFAKLSEHYTLLAAEAQRALLSATSNR
jgi:hypothetical protein